jgi:acyl-coenzyme A thioesterase PaaI-like protein
MTASVEAETQLVAAGDGRWTTTLSPAWNIGPNPNGGYAATPVLRALGELAGLPDPLTVTTHFLRPADGTATAEVRGHLHKRGRTSATASGTLVQGDRERVVVLATFADLAGAEPDGLAAPAPPDLPPPRECGDRFALESGLEIALEQRVEVRIHPDHVEPGATDEPRLACWIRFADGTPPASWTLPLLVDAPPPSIYTSLGAVGWVPTIELTVHVRRRPAAGWLRAELRTTELAGDRVVEDGVVWDASDAVVARSRQIAQLLRR